MSDAFDTAVRLLTRREHGVRQLQYKLKKRGFDDEVIAEALDACQRLNLQSDSRFAEGLCRSRIARGYGPFMIKQLLEHEGISTEMIEQVLAEAECEVDWVKEAASVWMKKFRTSDDASDLARQKQRQFLRYRGFTEATVRAMFETLEVESN